MKPLNMILAAGAVALSTGAANAATYYASSIEVVNAGTCTGGALCVGNDRKNTNNALGETNGTFYSLGLGGSAIFGFDLALFPASTVSAFEITFNPVDGHGEAILVETLDANKNVVQTLGTLSNAGGSSSLWASTGFSYIKLTDITLSYFANLGETTNSFDGFDVDSVSVAPVPLPAAGLMLLAGLGGFAAVRRRKTAA